MQARVANGSGTKVRTRLRRAAGMLVAVALLGAAGFATAALASSDRGAGAARAASIGDTSGSVSESDTTSTDEQPPPEVTVTSTRELADALAEPAEGTIIHLAAGVYDVYGDLERNNLTIATRGIQLLGAGRDVTTIKLLGKLEIDAPAVTISGIAFEGPGVWDSETHELANLGGPVVRAGGLVTDLTFTDNSVSGGYRGIALGGAEQEETAASHSLIEGNEFFHNEVAILVDGGVGNEIRDNDVHDNGNTDGDGPQAAILILDQNGALDGQPAGNTVAGNTVENTVNHGIMVRTSGNTISDNEISNAGMDYPDFAESSGITIIGSRNPAVDNTVSGNVIAGSGFAGVRIGDDVDGTTIEGNIIASTRNGGDDGDASGDSAGGAAILFTGYGATNTTITGNLLGSNTGYGIFVADADVCEDVCNEAHGNVIIGNLLGGVVNLDTVDFDATGNWWGSADGPSGEGPGAGDSVSDGVLFDPWATAPDCALANSCQTDDTEPPAITCPADITRSVAQGQSEVPVSFEVTATDNRPGVTVASEPASGSAFAIGATVVHATATDAAGNTSSCSFTVTVTKAPTSTALASGTNPSDLGAAVTFTATVTSNGAPVPTGSVQFRDGDTALGEPQSVNEDGVATLTTASLAAGAHTIAAQFLGDETRAASSSSDLSQTVTAPPPTTAATTTTATAPKADVAVSVAGPASVRIGEDATFAVRVSNAGPDESTGVQVQASLPAGASLVSASLSNGNLCRLGGGAVSCFVGTLAAGSSATASLVLSSAAAGALTVSAAVQGDYDASGRDNSSSATTAVLAPDAPPLPPPPPAQPGTFNAVGTGTVTINGVEHAADQIFQLNSGDVVDVAAGSLTFTTNDGDFATFSGTQPTSRRTSGRAARRDASDLPSQFKVTQVATPGAVTELTLVGGDFSVCSTKRSLSAKQTPVRALWGSAKGKFRTRARYSSATVRGTIWLTEDRCDGSLTRVVESVVDVLDLSLNRTVAVSAGQSYLALPKAATKPHKPVAPKIPKKAKHAVPRPRVYVVRDGDSLSTIASAQLGREHGWVDLARLNGLKAPYTVQPGDKLRLPKR